MTRNEDPNEIGVLWEKTGSKGPYFTGTIDGQRVVVFKNGHKRSDKAPDWRVLRAKPREQQEEALIDPRTDDDVAF